jgi:hypothetical protein
MYLRKRSYEEQVQELKNSQGILKWAPGMSLFNSNGGIDSSSLGYRYTMQTTTLIQPRVSKQKFYEIPFANYIPVRMGQGAYLEEIKTNVQYDSAGDFESGIQGTGQNTRISQVSTGLAPITYKIKTWVGGYQYSIMELEKALRADNWNVQEAKHRALVKRWQLGVQRVAFLGSYTDPTGVPGLLSNASVNISTSIIAQQISSMNYTQFATLVSLLMGDYFTNSNSTEYPTHFAIPQSDWNGLAVPVNPQFPVAGSMMIDYLQQAFVKVTGNPGFTIYPVAYADQANNKGVWTTNGTFRYCLYRKDEESGVMDIPLDLTQLAPNTSDNFNWNGVSYGQFTGMQIIRVPEFRYYDHT